MRLIGWLAYFCFLELLSTSASFAQTFPYSQCHIVLGPSVRYNADMQWVTRAPNVVATNWLFYMPVPPNLDYQRLLDVQMTADDSQSVGCLDRELGPVGREIISINIPVNDSLLQHEVHPGFRCSVMLSPRHLVQGPAAAVTALTAAERQRYLSSSQTMDFTSPTFQDWLQAKALRKHEKERDIDFAWHAFNVIRSLYSYNYQPGQSRACSNICTINQTDCGGLSILFASVMRANGVPARTLFGRHAYSATEPQDTMTGYGTCHVISEFYQDGIGWIPVEMSGAVSNKEATALGFFGRDPGDLIALHIDPDFVLDSVWFGQKQVRNVQNPYFIVKGKGSVNPWTQTIMWKVSKN